MRILLKFTTIFIAALIVYGCATQQTKPIEPITVFSSESIDGELTYTVDRRTVEMKQTRGNGVTFIEYGDDKVSPTPIKILDKALEENLKAKLNGRKVIINKFTIALKPVVVDSVYAPALAGISYPLAIMVQGAETYTDAEKYECDMKGAVGERTWWVRHDILPTDQGASGDIEELIMQCISVAINRISVIL